MDAVKKKIGRPRWSNSYDAIHARIRVVHGPAAAHACVSCGDQAREWAYDGADPNELSGPDQRGYVMAYSMDMSHYQPLCRECHWDKDRRGSITN